MATGDGWTSRLLAGWAEHLAAKGIGAWRPNGPGYTANEVGIVIRGIPTSPDRVITLAAYPVDDYVGLADTTVGIQHRIRGTKDPRVADDIGDAIYDLIDSAEHFTVGGIHVVLAKRRSYAPLGEDANGRWELSHNYYLDAMRPTANRT